MYESKRELETSTSDTYLYDKSTGCTNIGKSNQFLYPHFEVYKCAQCLFIA